MMPNVIGGKFSTEPPLVSSIFCRSAFSFEMIATKISNWLWSQASEQALVFSWLGHCKMA